MRGQPALHDVHHLGHAGACMRQRPHGRGSAYVPDGRVRFGLRLVSDAYGITVAENIATATGRLGRGA